MKWFVVRKLAWLFAPILPGIPACHAPPEPAQASSVCSLDGPALEQRLGEFDALVADAGTGMRLMPDGLMLRFQPRPGVRQALALWVENESQCCPSMEWNLSPEAHGDVVVLTLRGSAEAREFLLAHVPSIGRQPHF